MSENSLYQFAQVITEHPMHHSYSHPPSPLSNATFQAPRSTVPRRPLPIRKFYGLNCMCDEVQPRRGKNLPEGSLDSRAKKLHPQEKEDYEFSIHWLTEHAHEIYKGEDKRVVGLADVAEVSLCKAHSSTLYRAKKRHERGKIQAPPSPADSNGIDTTMIEHHQHQQHQQHQHQPPNSNTTNPNANRAYSDPYPLQPHPLQHPSSHHHAPSHHPYPPYSIREGGLAAKVREITYQQQYSSPPPPDFVMSSSTSLKRKRLSRQCTPPLQKPHSSASTPLYATGMAPLLSQHHPPSSSSSSSNRHVDSFSSHQLPPLHSRTPSLSSLSSSLQHQLQVSSSLVHPPQQQTPSVKEEPQQQQQHHSSSESPSPSLSKPLVHPTPQPQEPVIGTVSLKSIPATPGSTPQYYIRNLAITDSFTFRDLLSEIEMLGTPPPGKRIVVSDDKNEMIFPMDQAIRSVIRHPPSSHVELCLGLTDKPSIDWNTYA
ncbi:hypothetical protein BCR43DRAFT_511229 [Syncephalastrum racemosum]|uniref:Uncharacterized protein n=1 Tax=Syncephalastrum racemosum TaxID=13706 RepID=A0A1X2HLH0_SYNRA|nr:hypothetical protein BCR43DRAFT_511229 [Syncephalastrum racemosum]